MNVIELSATQPTSARTFFLDVVGHFCSPKVSRDALSSGEKNPPKAGTQLFTILLWAFVLGLPEVVEVGG